MAAACSQCFRSLSKHYNSARRSTATTRTTPCLRKWVTPPMSIPPSSSKHVTSRIPARFVSNNTLLHFRYITPRPRHIFSKATPTPSLAVDHKRCLTNANHAAAFAAVLPRKRNNLCQLPPSSTTSQTASRIVAPRQGALALKAL
jgi:hypothetical protein